MLKESDKELAFAFYRQAFIDSENSQRLNEKTTDLSGANALCIAQAQQACEKALKAWIIWQVGMDTYVRPGHLVWSGDLKTESLYLRNPVWKASFSETDLRDLRDRIQKVLTTENTVALSELENFAPFHSWGKPNTEYPWIDITQTVWIPADYFERDAVLVNKMSQLARRVVNAVKRDVPKFHNEFIKAKGQLGIN